MMIKLLLSDFFNAKQPDIKPVLDRWQRVHLGSGMFAQSAELFGFLFRQLTKYVRIVLTFHNADHENAIKKKVLRQKRNKKLKEAMYISASSLVPGSRTAFLVKVPWCFFDHFIDFYFDQILGKKLYSIKQKNYWREQVKTNIRRLSCGLWLKTLDDNYFYFFVFQKYEKK